MDHTNRTQNGAHVIMTDQRFQIRPSQQAVSACTGALLTAGFMTPLDVVKTRLQAQHSTAIIQKCFIFSDGFISQICTCGAGAFRTTECKPQLKGTFDAFIKITRAEGMRTLWSGLGPTVVSSLPATVVYFVAYEQLRAQILNLHKNHISNKQSSAVNPDMPIYVPMLSGISARICAVTCVSPLELVRTKMQSQKMTYSEITSALRNVIQTQGVRGLWRGLPPTILRDVPFSGIYWSSYEYIKGRYGGVDPSIGFNFIAGAVSGSLAALITNPFDVIKTHDQIKLGEELKSKNKSYKAGMPADTMLTRLCKIYYKRGTAGLFAGLGPRLFKVAPACAIMISSFEYGKSFFYHYNIQQHNISNQGVERRLPPHNSRISQM